MAQITWRDVAAPNFNSAAEGFSQFSKILGDSLGGLKGAVGAFDGAKSDLMNKQFQLVMSQMPDAAARRAAVASGNFGGLDITSQDFLRRASAATMTALGPEAIDARDRAQMELRQSKTLDSQQVALDAEAQNRADLEHAARSNDPSGIEAARQKINFGALGWSGAGKVGSLIADSARSQVSDDQSRFNFDNARTDRADASAVNEAVSAVVAGARTPDQARNLIYGENSPFAGLSPNARSAAEARVASHFPGLFSSSPGSSGATAAIAGAAGAVAGGSVGAAPAYTGAAGGFNGMSTPENAASIVKAATTLGIDPSELATVISYETGGKFDPSLMGGKNGNYMGLIQMGPEERAKYGVTSGMTFPAYMDAATRFLKDRGLKPGMGLLDLYSTINAGAPGRYNASDDGGKNNVRTHVERMKANHSDQAVRFLTGTNPAEAVRQSVNAGAAVGRRDMQDNDGLVNDMVKAMDDKTPTSMVVDRMIGPNGPFRGTNRDFMVDMVNKTMREAKVSAPVAEAIMTRSIAGSDEDLTRQFQKVVRQLSFGTVNLGSGARIDDRALAANIKRFGSGGIMTELSVAQDRANVRLQLESAKATVQQATAELQALRIQAVDQPQLRDMIPRQEAIVAAATTQLRQLSGVANSPTYAPATDARVNKAPAGPSRPIPGAARVQALWDKYTDGVSSR